MRPRTIAIISGWRHPDGPRHTVRVPATRAATNTISHDRQIPDQDLSPDNDAVSSRGGRGRSTDAPGHARRGGREPSPTARAPSAAGDRVPDQ
jgi:hypothetical protein